MNIEQMGINARKAARILAQKKTNEKNNLLLKLAENLFNYRDDIIRDNRVDVEAAKKDGLVDALIDRLSLDEKRLNSIIQDIKRVVYLDDPVGMVFDQSTLNNGLTLHKQGVPIGVIAVIYESRPNVTVEVTSLTLKTGNAVILRGGSETIFSNRSFVKIIRETLDQAGFPIDSVQFIDNPDRAYVTELLKMHDKIDMLIPRGAESLHKYCRENSLIPVITGGIGICHLYVDESADQQSALKVIQNAKVQRPSVCNALDTVLINRNIAKKFIPKLIDFLKEDKVSFRLHKNAIEFAPDVDDGFIRLAGPDDFDVEWLSLTLGIKVVDSLDDAIKHIMEHGTYHSDGILTQNSSNADKFVSEVDSAAVYVNASTRFTDGGQFNLGAEVAVSTQRLHARGPMGLRELTTYKWVVKGNYHIRD